VIVFSIHDYFSSKEIIYQTTFTETPIQNDMVESKHQHLFNVTIALLFQAHPSLNFLCFVLQHASYLINFIKYFRKYCR